MEKLSKQLEIIIDELKDTGIEQLNGQIEQYNNKYLSLKYCLIDTYVQIMNESPVIKTTGHYKQARQLLRMESLEVK